ncbi:uncharacterized protein F5147DRAFT_583329 [Suillus discolor]|uniref:Uncharacterized protein n=1 Tax=Suillus discolor TaxID=1912936 RepID=A0A9P7F0A5_9AGAM|nr:uncharacterized protein F5147DRAFT_583310 [Suillus discolor]XP_041288745.1 uncharacterized protein F5147DRAFT_583329 [Suillus discolor]KAG2097969.1 hypothetical protein F5147DRAFT_583310 [Suillus discolor]KAG2097987.1 hypothetical protein F5147DRAFT_583329 [Suillus discolor]
MSCGHGFITRKFVEKHTLCFDSLDACVALYERVEHSQEYKCCNIRIWGTPSPVFDIRPCTSHSKEPLTPKEKFSALFDKSVQSSWLALLGNRANTDPAHWSEEDRLEADDVRDWLSKQQLPGFIHGLSALQFLNNTVIFGLAKQPTTEATAAFIDKHRGMGSFQGLLLLGYNIDGRGSNWTNAAFLHFYRHLDASLAGEDKNVLQFSPIFAEHLLCKVKRYCTTFTKTDRTSFQALAKERTSNLKWVKGQNVKDSSGTVLPIPVVLDRESMDSIISSFEVRIHLFPSLFQSLKWVIQS